MRQSINIVKLLFGHPNFNLLFSLWISVCPCRDVWHRRTRLVFSFIINWMNKTRAKTFSPTIQLFYFNETFLSLRILIHFIFFGLGSNCGTSTRLLDYALLTHIVSYILLIECKDINILCQYSIYMLILCMFIFRIITSRDIISPPWKT